MNDEIINNRKESVTRSNDGSEDVQLFIFLSVIKLILFWFGPLLLWTGFASYFHHGLPQTIIDNSIMAMNYMLVLNFVFACSKYGNELISRNAKEMGEAFIFKVMVVDTIPPYLQIYCNQYFKNHFPPIPTAPPRIRCA
jgi:hypothetical protein